MSADGVTRSELHHRRIDMRGFRRSDGLFEVEGRVIDRKPELFAPKSGGRVVPAGEPLHDLGLRLVFDIDMVVVAVETFTDAAPYAACPGGGLALQAMKGVRIGAGWTREVRARLPRAHSCTHMVELLGPMATTAIQAMSTVRVADPDELGRDGRPIRIDTCYAYAADGAVVAERWPAFHHDPAPTEPTHS